MDFDLNEDQRMLRDTVAKLMDRLATPDYIRGLDRAQEYPYELYAAWAEQGLLRMPFPESHGGLGGNVIDMAIISCELGRKSFDFFTAYAVSVFCGLNIARYGSTAQHQSIVPRILDGSLRMAIGISEPDAGSDVGAMRTFAQRDGDHWVLNGQKLWSTGAGARDTIINVYAKTDRDVHYRKGISCFLVPNDTPGVELRKLDMLGRRCTGTYEIFFRDARIPADAIVGEVGKGWDYVLSALQMERIAASAGHCGAMQAVLDMALDYAKERKQFGRAIGSNQAIAHLLADMQTEVDAAQLLMWRAATQFAKTGNALKEVSMAKLFASETYVKAANLGMQIMGAYGYSMEFDMQRHFRDARSTTIGAGTSQMQRNLLAGLMGLKIE